MKRRTTSQPGSEFDHNIAWKSKQTAEGYDARRFSSLTGKTFNRFEQKAVHRCLDLVEKAHAAPKILDVPCGTGRITELLLKRGYMVVGGDISEEMMNVAKKRLKDVGRHEPEFLQMDIYSIQFDSGSFDCVTCIRLFQHLTSTERARALRELARVSTSFVIINVTYTSLYYGILRSIRKILRRYAPRHTTSKEELTRELSEAKLKVVKTIFPQPGYSGNMVLLLEKIQ